MSQDLFNEFVASECEGSQARAAQLLGLSESMVSRICSGDRGVSPDVANRIELVSEGRFKRDRFIWGDSPPSAVVEAA